MSDLAEFLLARIAEDEAMARYSQQMQRGNTHWSTPWDTFNPARVLARCKADRRIVDSATYWIKRTQSRRPDMTPTQRMTIESRARAAEETLRLLALPYADHPDYREQWKL